jgi:hypothetical protein
MSTSRLFLAILMLSACSESIHPRPHSQVDCGIPFVISLATQGRVIVGPELGLEQQLPEGVIVDDGCWTKDGGRLTGNFESETTDTTFVFEFKDAHWKLIDTQTEKVVRNPYSIGHSIR